jgi:hypothetical protein
MVRGPFRLLAVILTLAGVVAGCGEQAKPLPSELPVRHQSGLQPDAASSLEAAGPVPEYRLELALDAAASRLDGRAQVRFPNRSESPLDEIVFRLYPNLPQYGGRMSVGSVWVDGRRASSAQRAGDTVLAVPLPRPLAPDASALISLTFTVEIPAVQSGHALFSHSQGIWSVPDAYPLLAVHDQGGWREDVAPPQGDAVFAAAARYDVALELPSDLVLATTGTIVSQTQQAEGSRLYWITGDGLREFAWFASPDYRTDETTAGGVRLRSYYLVGDEGRGQAALAIGRAALSAYAVRFGPYPYRELKVVEGPLANYGMEYPGLALLGLDLYRDRSDQFEIRLAHEVAHQWWYAQVGNDQVNTPWLDEGLAEYSTAVYEEQAHGPDQARALVNQRWEQPYEVAVNSGIDDVVNQPAAAFGANYEVMVYAKAALFFNAVRRQIGDQAFFGALRAYTDRYRWQVATPDELLAVLQSASGQDLEALYAQWILSKR